MSEELLPCPFHKGSPDVWLDKNKIVHCSFCNYSLPLEKWNNQILTDQNPIATLNQSMIETILFQAYKKESGWNIVPGPLNSKLIKIIRGQAQAICQAYTKGRLFK